MSLFTKLFEAVHSWRRRRGGIKPRKRSDLAMEQLDHRQLLAVNFTGVVATDFPVTTNPGVQVIADAPISQGGTNTVPLIPTNLQGVINVSGFQINQLRVSYTQADDTLNVGLEGPPNGRDGRQVIAGDSDNNGNSATVDPRVSALSPAFVDPADMGGSKTYGVSLYLNNAPLPQIAAGFPIQNPTGSTSKPYEVARAIFPAGGTQLPNFDQNNVLPQYTGNYYLANDPNHPNFELQISHFSQLYQQTTGLPFTPQSPVSLGAFGSTLQNGGISDEIFPPQAVNFPQATVPLPPPPVPPVPPPPPPPPVIQECAPTILVNPHLNYHVNTAHNGAIRVSVLGSSGFDPTTIVPSSVRFGNPATIATNGASPILNFENNVNRDQFPDETFVFNGLNVVLPPGITNAEITGTTTSGQNFASTVRVFNRDASYYPQTAINQQQAAFAKYDLQRGIDTTNGLVAPPPVIPRAAQQRAASAAINDLYNPFQGARAPAQVNPNASTVAAQSYNPITAPTSVVSIPRKHGKAVKTPKGHAPANANAAAATAVPQGISMASSSASTFTGMAAGGA